MADSYFGQWGPGTSTAGAINPNDLAPFALGSYWIRPEDIPRDAGGNSLVDQQARQADAARLAEQDRLFKEQQDRQTAIYQQQGDTNWSGSYGSFGGANLTPATSPTAPAPAPMQTMPQQMGPAAQPGSGYAPPAQAQAGGWQGSATSSPYLSAQADEIGRRSQQALGQAFNGIRSNAVGVGGLGGSRQGVAEGMATGMANDALTGNLANLYGTDWTNQQNRNLSQYGRDQGFYTAQRGQDQTGAALGANLYSQGQQGQWGPINNANNVYGNYTGLGNTTQTQNSGGGWQGAVGGLAAGAGFGSQMGWW
jgi:hypothetical protein